MSVTQRGFSLSTINGSNPEQQQIMRNAMIDYRQKHGHFKGLYQYPNLYCTECKQEANKLNSIKIIDPERLEYAKLLCIDCAVVKLKQVQKNCTNTKCEEMRRKATEQCNFTEMVIENLRAIEKEAKLNGNKDRQNMARADIKKAQKECTEVRNKIKRVCRRNYKQECNSLKAKTAAIMDNVDNLKLKQQILALPKAPTQPVRQNSPPQQLPTRAYESGDEVILMEDDVVFTGDVEM